MTTAEALIGCCAALCMALPTAGAEGSAGAAPGVPWENLKALAEGFRHYREHGRA